jgi:hypothetical protein
LSGIRAAAISANIPESRQDEDVLTFLHRSAGRQAMPPGTLQHAFAHRLSPANQRQADGQKSPFAEKFCANRAPQDEITINSNIYAP